MLHLRCDSNIFSGFLTFYLLRHFENLVYAKANIRRC